MYADLDDHPPMYHGPSIPTPHAHFHNPTQPNTCTLKVVEQPRKPGNIEFDTRVDTITAASGHIAQCIQSGMLTCTIHESADHVQLLLKYVETGIYDPADISRRSADKQYVVFSQIEFYLFCIPMECPSLCDIVRVGIQSGIEVMAWGPTLGDNDWFLVTDMGSPAHAGLLCWLFERGGGLFAELPDGDALKSSLLRYLNNLWQFYRTYFREGTAEFYINKDHKKVREAMKLYRQNVPVDIYESDAVKYGVSEESSGWSRVPKLLSELWK